MTGTFYPDEQQPAISASLSLPGGRDWSDIAGNARHVLHCCVRGLSMLSSSTEDEFIMIAETLENASVHAKKTPAPGGPELNVEGVVTLIQFHDITRQQFERSSLACRAMIKKLAATDGERPGTVAAGERGVAATAEDLALFCVDQAKAIGETKETFVTAVTRLIRQIGLIIGETRKTAGDSAAAEIEPAVDGICVHKFVTIVAEEVLSALNDLAAEMRPFVTGEGWEKIIASAGPTEAPGIGTGFSSDAENTLGDNVELF